MFCEFFVYYLTYFVNLDKWIILFISFAVWGMVKRRTLCECFILLISFHKDTLKGISVWNLWSAVDFVGVMRDFSACVSSLGLQGAAKCSKASNWHALPYFHATWVTLVQKKCIKSQSKHSFSICHCVEESWGSHI